MSLKDRVAREGPERNRQVDLVALYLERLLAETDRNELAGLNGGQRRARLERRLGEILSIEGPVMSDRERSHLIARVVDDALGLGVLEPLLADESITEIMVNGPDDVFVERRGRIERHPTVFSSAEQLMQTIDRIVSRVNRRVDESSPMVDARLDTGERVNVIIPPLALNGPTLTIRRFPRPYRIPELIANGTLDQSLVALLNACVRARLSMLISGGTGSGKTTFLNAMSGLIPDRERIVTIEDAAELSLQQEHVVTLESRPPNVEGTGEVTIRDLVRNSLRMRPDRIIVGEVRGAETMDMLQAMNTGHEGSLATVHANSCADALGRLETLATMSELDVPYDAVRDQINSALDLIIQLNRGVDGARRVVEVTALVSRRRDEYQLHPVSEFIAEPAGPERVVRGKLRHHPLPVDLARRLLLAGEQVPPAFRPAGPLQPLHQVGDVGGPA
jgi:pilus assembly protein CpaF